MATVFEEMVNDENVYMVHIGNINYNILGINDTVSFVLDANNQMVFLIDWDEETIRPYEDASEDDASEDGDIEWDQTLDEEIWVDDPAPIPISPNPEDLPEPPEYFLAPPEPLNLPPLHEIIFDYNPDTDIGYARLPYQTYEIHHVSTNPTIFFCDLEVGWFENNIPYFF